MLFAKRTQGLKLGKGKLYLVNYIEKGVLFFESLKIKYLDQLLAGLTYELPTLNIANVLPMGKCNKRGQGQSQFNLTKSNPLAHRP